MAIALSIDMNIVAHNSSSAEAAAIPCTLLNQTFLCSDVVGFTNMTERLGDLQALAVMTKANREIRSRALLYDGVEWELRGDGFLFTFPDPRKALLSAIAIQRLLKASRSGRPEPNVRVRIAIHAGPAYFSEHRLFGQNLILAFRLMDYADTNGIVVSEEVRCMLASEWAGHFSRRVKITPKGFSRKVNYSSVLWESDNRAPPWVPITGRALDKNGRQDGFARSYVPQCT